MENLAYSEEMIQQEIKRHGYKNKNEYRSQFNASSVSCSLEINVRNILDGEKDDHQSTFDLYNIKKSWANKVEVRGVTDNVNFSSSSNLGKGRYFSVDDFVKKVNGNDAFIICDFHDLILFNKTPRLYIIPTDLIKDLFYRNILQNNATLKNDWPKTNKNKLSKTFGFVRGKSPKLGENLVNYPDEIFNLKFYHIFPYETFKLTTSTTKKFPSTEEVVKNAKIRLQQHRETGKINH